ncbi:hypothetical protein EVAR_67446_1 [Eumeta japonica]|uniref:Uncharacterized protein n=1 Tax=Eumeta variegata TaxID=151549 RepID=A0A4C2A4B0_EUMVA|nr:hypothetical protein EVAR_67446_1 [Eumeta japonica]
MVLGLTGRMRKRIRTCSWIEFELDQLYGCQEFNVTLSLFTLTDINGWNQDWLPFINMFNNIVVSRADLKAGSRARGPDCEWTSLMLYNSDSQVLLTFDQLVRFLEEGCRLCDDISREMRGLGSNAIRRLTFDQEATRAGRAPLEVFEANRVSQIENSAVVYAPGTALGIVSLHGNLPFRRLAPGVQALRS